MAGTGGILGSVVRRFALFAIAAVVLPVAIVAALGFVSLRQWEHSAESLFREQARDMVTMFVDKVDTALEQAEARLLRGLDDALAADAPLSAALDALVGRTPLVARLYLLDRAGARLYPAAIDAEESRRLAALVEGLPAGFWEQGGRRTVAVLDVTVLAVLRRGRGGAPVLAAIVPSAEALRREVFERALGGLEASSVVAVLDHGGRPVWARPGAEGARPMLAMPLGRDLPDWRLALYETAETSPRALARRQVLFFTVAWGALLAVIVAGLAVTYRLVRREVEMARLKSDFVANVSHDLKTPLSVIRMFAETLEMGRIGDEGAREQYYRVIARESERLSRLIDNVLDFSRIESGRHRYEPVPTAVEPLVRETLETFAYPLERQGFAVEVSVAPDLPEVSVDPDALGQALSNLVDNAIKYSEERKRLGVDVRVRDGQLAIAVDDAGVGIPRAEQARIFDKFYRAGRSETQGRRGSGVGLALVRHVAAAHGGRVTVESEPGAGSRFTLWLPLAPPARGR